eukprot:gene16225-22080_t
MRSTLMESDEAFARRLQAQEMGNFTNNPVPIDVQTPLVNRNNDNPTVINSRLSEISTSRATLGIILIVNLPQILSAIIILAVDWNSAGPDGCASSTVRWKWWALFSAIRMFLYCGVVTYMHVHFDRLQQNPIQLTKVTNFRNTVDAFGLIWFVVGNMWLFGNDGSNCTHPDRSPLYNLSIMLIPIFCFCMPCLIRILARLQSRAPAGASENAISELPLITIEDSHIQGSDDHTCPICLNEMAVGDQARSFRCNHIFHKQCVDEWLRVNASCPTCRKLVFGDAPSSQSISLNPTSQTQSSINPV